MGDARSPTIFDVERLRERAAAFRKLADEHADAESWLVARKLREVAAELEAKADELQRLEPQQARSPSVH
jgi:hypothetical protein